MLYLNVQTVARKKNGIYIILTMERQHVNVKKTWKR